MFAYRRIATGITLTCIGSAIYLYYGSPAFESPRYAPFLVVAFAISLVSGSFLIGQSIVMERRKNVRLVGIALALFTVFIGIPLAFYYNFVYGITMIGPQGTMTVFVYGPMSLLPIALSSLLLLAIIIFSFRYKRGTISQVQQDLSK